MIKKNLWITLITLIVAIFVFAQVYILFAVSQIGTQLVQLEGRIDKRFIEMEGRIDKRFAEVNQRFNLIESRLDTLNQNYIDHLAHHIGERSKEN